MFDGSFRTRKEVNLSRGSRRRQQQKRSSNKQDLLNNAQALRKQRQQHQRQEKAALLIQKTTRGWQARLKCLRDFWPRKGRAGVSLCLSLEKWLFVSSRTAKELLLEFASGHPQISQTGNDGNVLMDEDSESAWFSEQRIVRFALHEFVPKMNETEREALFSILKTFWPVLRIDVPFFIDLIACLKQWWQDPTSDQTYATAILIWSIEAHKSLQKPHTDALLASVLLSADTNRLSSLDDLYISWFFPLIEALNCINNGDNDGLLKATFRNLQGGKDHVVLKNLLDLAALPAIEKNPLPIVKFINYVLSRSKASPLTFLSSLLVRGDSLDATTVISNNSEWVDDESDHEDEESETDLSRPDVKRPRSTTKYSRKDLLTMVKLDKLFQERTQQMKRDCIVDLPVKELAQKIVSAHWLPWGLKLLDDPSSRTQYIDSLALLLQSSASLRPSMKVGVLSKLAFSKPFLEKLWLVVQSSAAEGAMIVFCELFSHYLVGLSDVDFLKLHTNHGGIFASLLAQDVVLRLNTALYDVYWTKPVFAREMQEGTSRARILLSGTKLWNSLYERWNRLGRHPFCDESTWWFPQLASKEGDGAVIPAREQQQQENDDDHSGSMDVEDDASDDQSMEISPAEAETDALADSFRDPKMARILTCIPQALPFDRRVKLFHSLLKGDKQKVFQAAASRRAMMAMQGQQQEDFWFESGGRERVQIRRAALYDDSMKQLNELGPKLKHKVQVSFINQHGAEEAGIDGGGVFKEFLDDLIKDGFAVKNDDSDVGAPPLFSVTPVQTLAVNLDLADDQSMLVHYEFLGRVLGKAVYESILVEPQFCLPFLNQLLAKTNTTEDLKNIDEEYYNNLNKLRSLSEADIESLGMTFEMTIGGNGGSRDPHFRPRTVELVPGGRSIPVTQKNVFQFIHLVSHQRMNVQGSMQTRSFLRGFRDLIPASWVRLFSASELQKLIGGDDSIRGVDVASLRQAMNYLGGYHQSQPYIDDFWDILENELTPDQQRKFLKFMTSCSRQPLLGFGSLEPAPSIQQIRLSDAELSLNSKLPTSQTCLNLLKLPNYKNRNLLKKKLVDAIEAGAGFELT